MVESRMIMVECENLFNHEDLTRKIKSYIVGFYYGDNEDYIVLYNNCPLKEKFAWYDRMSVTVIPKKYVVNLHEMMER